MTIEDKKIMNNDDFIANFEKKLGIAADENFSHSLDYLNLSDLAEYAQIAEPIDIAEEFQNLLAILERKDPVERWELSERFWDNQEGDPLFSDRCSPYLGSGIVWDVAEECVEELTKEDVIQLQLERGSLRNELADWPYVENVLERLEACLDTEGLTDEEILEIEKTFLAAYLIYRYIEQSAAPDTHFDFDTYYKNRLDKEKAVPAHAF